MIFLNSASSAAALVFYLPGVCTHNNTEEKIFGKNTIFNEHPVSNLINHSSAACPVFEEVHQNSKEVWKWEMYRLVEEYDQKPGLAPPFVIIGYTEFYQYSVFPSLDRVLPASEYKHQ